LTYYLNCPAWSFVLAGGICGEQAVAGVTIPSVDRVGRYFNFTMASILPADIVPAKFASTYADWLDGLENLALSVLEEEMDQDGIDDSINSSAAELNWFQEPRPAVSSGPEHTRILSDVPTGVSELMPQLLHQMMIKDHDRYGLWWHHGSSQVSAQLVTCASMPSEEIYLGLMMDDEVIPTPFESTQPPEVDYMDELLSD
jgi:type VI secretion system protein ImpM